MNDDPTDRAPQFLSGNRRISLAALRERIEIEFAAETDTRPDLLLDSANEAAQRDLIRDVANYVLSVESINLPRADRLALLDELYHDLFRFGPLSRYLDDQNITEITIDGPERVYIRSGAAEMRDAEVHFDDAAHLERLVRRVLAIGGAQLNEHEPFLEVGVSLAGRTARLTIISAPISPVLHIDMRLRPAQAATLPALIVAGMLDETTAKRLETIIVAGQGLMIVGDVGTGKTTLLEALLPLLTPAEATICVERTAELHLPPRMQRLTAIPPMPNRDGVEFGTQISAALDKSSTDGWLVLDEIRFDESAAMWQALIGRDGTQRPRCLWSFRGATEALRLRTAFSMSVRRAQPGVDQALIYGAMLDRLPHVALLARRDQKIQLIQLAQWHIADENVLTLR